MDEIIAKMKELETLIKAQGNIISCEVNTGSLGLSILVHEMANVPTKKGTTYTKTDSSLPYAKTTVIDGVKVNAWGTLEEMRNEVA